VNGLVREVTAIHLLALAQAIDLRGEHLAGAGGARRARADPRGIPVRRNRDRRLEPRPVAAVNRLIESGALRARPA